MTINRSRRSSPACVAATSSSWSGSTASATTIPPSPKHPLLHDDDWGEWQAAVYLLTGCHEAWTALGPEILASRSIGPVVHELDHGHRGWSSSELLLLRWAAHFWDVGRSEVSFPYSFDEFNFRRWITACHLYKHIPPAPEDTSEAAR